MIIRPKNIEHEILHYTDPSQSLVDSDMDIIRKRDQEEKSHAEKKIEAPSENGSVSTQNISLSKTETDVPCAIGNESTTDTELKVLNEKILTSEETVRENNEIKSKSEKSEVEKMDCVNDVSSGSKSEDLTAKKSELNSADRQTPPAGSSEGKNIGEFFLMLTCKIYFPFTLLRTLGQ